MKASVSDIGRLEEYTIGVGRKILAGGYALSSFSRLLASFRSGDDDAHRRDLRRVRPLHRRRGQLDHQVGGSPDPSATA